MKKIFITSILFLLMAVCHNAKAQPPNPGGGGAEPGCWPPPCVPIDGGLSWLLIAGTIYGGKKIYDINSKSDIKF